ncbi:uncharacterized protein FTOL_08412 [Fusarium torulosum]|jgi:hypothetical protein
MPN